MSDFYWLDPDELRTISAFYRSARAVFTQVDRDLQREVGITRTYIEILWRLQQAPGHALRMSELADLTESMPSRITHAVGRLELAGHVRRELAPKDRRGWSAVLTEQGAEMLRLAGPQYARSVRKYFFALLSPTQRDQLTHISETLIDNLSDAHGPPRDEHRNELGPGAMPDQVGVSDH